ncbi:hypothetical protein VKT23_018424 [Stygiomarasmius scandens]|uniref:Uncharacterized protein n=1 Tax=Marasmiellus scandens TaxID=2682957 RepID=A0ABR1IRB3_9AGAR
MNQNSENEAMTISTQTPSKPAHTTTSSKRKFCRMDSKTDLNNHLSGSGFWNAVRGELDLDQDVGVTPRPKALTTTIGNDGEFEVTPMPIRSQSRRGITDPTSSSRASVRAARLLSLQREQQREDDEALTMTEDQRRILLSSFSSVNFEFFDLDGLSWSHSALKRRMQYLASLQNGRGHRHTASESNILMSPTPSAPAMERKTKSAIVSSPLSSPQLDTENDEDKDQKTIRASVSPVKRPMVPATTAIGESPVRSRGRRVGPADINDFVFPRVPPPIPTAPCGPPVQTVDGTPVPVRGRARSRSNSITDGGVCGEFVRVRSRSVSQTRHDDADVDVMMLDGMEPVDPIPNPDETTTVTTCSDSDDDAASLYTSGLANEIRRTRSNTVSTQPLLVEIETTKEVSDDSASVYTSGLADEIQRTRSNSLASQPLLVHVKQETVKIDQVQMVVKVEVEKEVVDGEEEKAHEFAQGVVKEVQRSRSGSLVEVKVDTEVVRCVDEDLPRLRQRSQSDIPPPSSLPHRLPTSFANLVSNRDAPPPPTASLLKAPRSPERLGLRPKKRLASSSSPTNRVRAKTSASGVGGGGVSMGKSRSAPAAASSRPLKRKDTPMPGVLVGLDQDLPEPEPMPMPMLMQRGRSEPGLRKDTPIPAMMVGAMARGANAMAVVVTEEDEWFDYGEGESMIIDMGEEEEKKEPDPFAAASALANIEVESYYSDEAESEAEESMIIETDLEGGAVMRRAPMSPRSKKASGGRSSPNASPRSKHGKASAGLGFGVYPKFEIYARIEEEEEEKVEDNEATIKAKRTKVLKDEDHDATLRVRTHPTQPQDTVPAVPKISVDVSLPNASPTTDNGLSVPSAIHARVPSLVMKNKEDLRLVTSEYGLASPSVLTPTPSLIKGSTPSDAKEDGVKESAPYPSSLGAGLPSSSCPLAPRTPPLQNPTDSTQSNKRKRTHTSGRSISSSGSLLGMTSVLSGTSPATSTSSDSTQSNATPLLHLPPRPMSPPSPPTVAFVTASRTVGGGSGALEGLRAMTTGPQLVNTKPSALGTNGTRKRAGTVAGTGLGMKASDGSHSHSHSHAHGPNLNSVRRMDGMESVHGGEGLEE